MGGESKNYQNFLLNSIENLEKIIKLFQDQIDRMKKKLLEQNILLKELIHKNSFKIIKSDLI